MKLSKCRFAQTEVPFLGHIVGHGHLKVNPKSVESILKWQRPVDGGKKAVSAVRGFLGMAGWYRKFIPHFAAIARPLVDLTKKDAVWNWTPQCQQAFDALRRALTTAPVLILPDPNKDYILHSDASDYAMGEVLMQADDDGHLHPVAYASKVLNKHQRNYLTTDREAFALVWGLMHFNTYIEGHKYTLVTDHAALTHVKTRQDVNSRAHRLFMKLSPYHIDLYHAPGSTHYGADLLSREKEMLLLASSLSMHVHIDCDGDGGMCEWCVHDNVVPVMVLTEKRPRGRPKGSKAGTHKDDNTAEFEVESVIGRRPVSDKVNQYEYLVRWKNYSPSHDEWLTIDQLSGAHQIVSEFERKRQAVDFDSVGEFVDGCVAPPERFGCAHCRDSFVNRSALLVHNFYEHDESIPLSSVPCPDIVDPHVFAALQREDASLSFIIQYLRGRSFKSFSAGERKALMSHEFVFLDNDLVYCVERASLRTRSHMLSRLRLVVPLSQVTSIVMRTHVDIAHRALIHTYNKLRETWWWPGMFSSVARVVGGCVTCTRANRARFRSPTQPMPVPSGPWVVVHVDLVGPLPRTKAGHTWILVCIDRFSRSVEAFPLRDDELDSASLARHIINGVICRHGFMTVLVSDNGRNFVSALARAIYADRCSTAQHHSSPPASQRRRRACAQLHQDDAAQMDQ